MATRKPKATVSPPKNVNIIWRPQPKQALMMSRPEYEALYGGAAGGGKSDYLLVEALRQVNIKNYRGIIFRKTYPELQDLIDRSDELYRAAYPSAKYNDSKHRWSFPSGAKIAFGAMQYTRDRKKYQGKHFDFIGFDELTHFTYDEYSYMYSRNRPSGPGTRVYMRATANPGGVGHGWVKQYFVKASKPGTPITTEVEILSPKGEKIKKRRTKIFIPSSVFDNKILLDQNPNYLASLALLPKQDRDALLYGDWDSFEGQVFTEFIDDPDGYLSQRNTHVIEPFRIPDDWLIYRGFDFGYAKPFSVGWHAVDHEGCIYRIKELYGCTGTPNTGVKIEPSEIARQIHEVEDADPNLRGRKIIGIADPSIFDESRGESVAAIMERCRIYWSPGDNTRIAGKMQYHYRLAFDANGRAMFYVFNTCKDFIRTIPSLTYDEKRVEDIDTTQEDHIYDECRYVLMERPISPRKNMKEHIPQEDPLNMYQHPITKGNYYRI